MILEVGQNRYVPVDLGLRLAAPAVFPEGPPRPVFLISSFDCDVECPTEVVKLINWFHREDDVFDQSFVSNILLVADDSPSARRAMLLQTELAGEIIYEGKLWDLDFVYNVDILGFLDPVPSGPCFLERNAVFSAFKIVTDKFSCFQTTVLPTRTPYHFENLDSIGPNGSGKSIAIPSRRYGRPSPSKPLASYRIGIKDNFKIAGIKTSLGNRSFLATYGVDGETAVFGKTILDKDGFIVGKTKMTAFASGEKPIDWFDYQCPFNPRADGYLDPGSSSTGSAAAAAAYAFIDVCVGTDTNGSMREPAARCGVYGIRYSTDGWGPETGLYPCCPVFDAAGACSRDLTMLFTFSKAVLESTTEMFRDFPKEILYPTDFFPVKKEAQQVHIDHFVEMLEVFLGVRKTMFSLAERWREHPPPEAYGKSLAEYSLKTGYNPFYYDIYHEYDTFRDEHVKKFGSEAYVSPSMQWRWDRGAEISENEVEQSHKELKVLQSWFAKAVLQADNKTGSTAILILPVGPTEPNYRDTYILPAPRLGIDALSLGSMMRMPQLVVPVGQVDYDSRVSGRKESLPVCASIAGANGSDLMLLNLAVKALENAKFPTQVSTGRYAFPVGVGLKD